MNIDELRKRAIEVGWLFDIDKLSEENKKLTIELLPYMREGMSFSEQQALFKAIKYDRDELACLIKVTQNPKLTEKKKYMYAKVIASILPELDTEL
jgi:hypothetical protein